MRCLPILLLSLCAIPAVALAQDTPDAPSAPLGVHLEQVCFGVADERFVTPQDTDNDADTLTTLDPNTAETHIIGQLGTHNVEAMTFGPHHQLYAADASQVGIVDPLTGQFSALPQPIGSGRGALGNFDFKMTDSDGLAYSLDRNLLFGTQRRFDGDPGGAKPDLFYAINPTTGAIVPNFFGPGVDYVVVPAVTDDLGNSLTDIDDIQFDPITGVLYGVINTSGASGVLVTIDVATGHPTVIATMRYADKNAIIDDVEGLSFGNNGVLYASTGDNYTGPFDDRNTLFEINTTTAQGRKIGPFPKGPKDYEGLACLSQEAAIVLQKSTNGPGQAPEDADTPTGPRINAGDPVTWTYTFTNTGVLTLTNLSLVDTPEGLIDCPPPGTILPPGKGFTCVATGIAQGGQYTNTATVTGTTNADIFFPAQSVSDTNPSHYFGVLEQSGIAMVKLTYGPGQTPDDADAPTGPIIHVGDPVTWRYEVHNTGNVPLSNVKVTDDKLTVAPVYVSGDLNSDGKLDLTEVWIFQATGTAVAGQYANTGTVTGTPPSGPNVSSSNPSHYFGVTTGITILKRTNGDDADSTPGPLIRVGDPVTWTYEVRNTGNVPLGGVVVTDDVSAITPTYVSGDLNDNGLLDPSEVWLFQDTGIAVAGQYTNTGTAYAVPPVGPNVTATNPSHYFGVNPGIVITKYTNGFDADLGPGPAITIGMPITWTYYVTNTGNVPLSNVKVTDDKLTVAPVYVSGDLNSNGLLDVAEVWLFRATGIAVGGPYVNNGTVTGTSPVGTEVSASNPSHYVGSEDTGPTDLPTGPQPQQKNSLFLPSLGKE